MTACGEASTCIDASGDKTVNLVALSFVDDWTKPDRFFSRIAYGKMLSCRGETLNVGIGDPFMSTSKEITWSDEKLVPL